jgi:hypothetical protein
LTTTSSELAGLALFPSQSTWRWLMQVPASLKKLVSQLQPQVRPAVVQLPWPFGGTPALHSPSLQQALAAMQVLLQFLKVALQDTAQTDPSQVAVALAPAGGHGMQDEPQVSALLLLAHLLSQLCVPVGHE